MIASTLPTGRISYLGYANKITSKLETIATIGISTTIFPVMARSWAENDLVKVREYFAIGMIIYILLGHFLAKTLSYRGLAIAYSAQFVFGLTVSMIVMRRIYGGVNGKRILEGLTQILIASLCGGISIYCSFRMVFVGNSLMMRSVMSAILGIVIYIFLVIYILKLEEALLLKKKLSDNLGSLQIWRQGSRC